MLKYMKMYAKGANQHSKELSQNIHPSCSISLFIYLSACKKYLKKYHIRPLSTAEPCREIQYILPAYVCVLCTGTEDDIFGIEVISAIKADTKSQQLHCFGVGS